MDKIRDLLDSKYFFFSLIFDMRSEWVHVTWAMESPGRQAAWGGQVETCVGWGWMGTDSTDRIGWLDWLTHWGTYSFSLVSSNFLAERGFLCMCVCTGVRAWHIQTFFTCLTSKILHFSIQIIYDLEENLAKIHLPNWQFYLARVVCNGICQALEMGDGGWIWSCLVI